MCIFETDMFQCSNVPMYFRFNVFSNAYSIQRIYKSISDVYSKMHSMNV